VKNTRAALVEARKQYAKSACTQSLWALRIIEYCLDPKTGFDISPASRDNHHAYDGGLLEHSVEVWAELTQLNTLWGLGLSDQDLLIAALGHDLEKVGRYRLGTRNKKVNGQWVQVPDYKYSPDTRGFGHAVGSVTLMQQLAPIGLLEADARRVLRMVRWHMGPWEVGSADEKQGYSRACEIDQAVLALHTADMRSVGLNASVMERVRAERGD
jgi:hypothetical protein